MPPVIDELYLPFEAEVKLQKASVGRAFYSNRMLGFRRSLQEDEIRFDGEFLEGTFSDTFSGGVRNGV